MPANETGTDREAGQEPPKEISVLISGEVGSGISNSVSVFSLGFSLYSSLTFDQDSEIEVAHSSDFVFEVSHHSVRVIGKEITFFFFFQTIGAQPQNAGNSSFKSVVSGLSGFLVCSPVASLALSAAASSAGFVDAEFSSC